MTTVTMNISLTDDLKAFVDTCVKSRGYSSSSEFVRDLLRREEDRQKEERLKALIQEGLDSPIDPRPWEEIRESWSNRINAARQPVDGKPG
jgi:antitoxin ParD1/3/4